MPHPFQLALRLKKIASNADPDLASIAEASAAASIVISDPLQALNFVKHGGDEAAVEILLSLAHNPDSSIGGGDDAQVAAARVNAVACGLSILNHVFDARVLSDRSVGSALRECIFGRAPPLLNRLAPLMKHPTTGGRGDMVVVATGVWR
jgi:hypothetical protein